MSLVLLRSQTDERLVALAGEGHERAFEAIVKRYRRPLYAACRRMVPDARAEDVLQQSLVSAWTALRRGDEVRDLRAWLFRIVRNAAVSELRRSGHAPPQLLDTLIAAPSPQEEAERRAVVHETLATVAGLPERQREALLRIAVQGRSQDEVAEEFGVSRVAVRQLVHRARTSLRAAASAVVPLPVVAWLASAGTGSEPLSLRIAQLAAGAGGASAGAVVLKTGVVAGIAVTATASAPLLAEHRPPRPAAVEAARAVKTATPAPSPTATAAPTRTAVAPAGGARTVAAVVRQSTAGRERHRSARRAERRRTASAGEEDAARAPARRDEGDGDASRWSGRGDDGDDANRWSGRGDDGDDANRWSGRGDDGDDAASGDDVRHRGSEGDESGTRDGRRSAWRASDEGRVGGGGDRSRDDSGGRFDGGDRAGGDGGGDDSGGDESDH